MHKDDVSHVSISPVGLVSTMIWFSTLISWVLNKYFQNYYLQVFFYFYSNLSKCFYRQFQTAEDRALRTEEDQQEILDKLRSALNEKEKTIEVPVLPFVNL